MESLDINNLINKFNPYDEVEIKLDSDNIFIKSYIYEINNDDKKYLIYNTLTDKFEYIDYSFEKNMYLISQNEIYLFV